MQLRPRKTQNREIHREPSIAIKTKSRKRKVQDDSSEKAAKRTKKVTMKNKRINYSNLPYALQSSIFEKLTFKQFAFFEESNSFAYSMCEKRRKMKYPHEIEKLRIWGSFDEGDFKIDKFEKQIKFSEVGDQVQFSIKSCRTYLTGPLSQERFDFYTQKVKYFEHYFCFFEPHFDPLFARFIKTTKIDEITFNPIDELNLEIPYDTSHIDTVILMATGVSCEVAFSLKAKRNAFVMSAVITPQDILGLIQTILTTSALIPIRAFELQEEMKLAELEEALKTLRDNCIRVKVDHPRLKDLHSWAIVKPGDIEPYLDLVFASKTLISIVMCNYLD